MKTALHLLLLTCCLATGIRTLVAQTSMVPSAMNYQGVLTDASGNPVAPTTPENRNVEFRLFNAASGGTALWGEAQTVTVFKGNFSVILGSGTAIGVPSGPASFASVFTNAASADLFFGITPQGGAEFAPRQKLLASAFALRAKTAETVNATAQAAGVPSQFNWLSARNLTIDGHTKINGSNVLEFGVGIPDRVSSAGQIGYNVFNTPGLSIVGGAENGAARKLTLWAEGGTSIRGPITLPFFGQSISLGDSFNGLGVQQLGTYQRAFANFAWFTGGVHSDVALNPGGGTRLATLNGSGFNLESGRFTGDGGGLTNVPIPSTVNNLSLNGTINKNGHGPFISSFGEGHVFGSQSFTTYERTARNFAWYLGGSHNDAELNAGGGTRLMTLTSNGLEMNTGGLSLPASSLSFGSRLGQHINLWGNEFGLGIQTSAMYFRIPANGAFNWYAGGTHSDTNAGGGAQIANWLPTRFDFYRRVFISASPTDGQPPLDVSGTTNVGGNQAVALFALGNTGVPTSTASNMSLVNLFGVSIRASGFVVAGGFAATSDLRLKLPEGRSDAAKDLETLGALEVTDYTMKDKVANGGRKFKKLIAQQVEKAYPPAVSKTTGTVPDIFRKASAKSGVIALEGPGESGLKKGETVRLLQGERDFSAEVTEVTKAGFTVKDSIEDGDLFVYGRKVDDLRTVDYEAVAMLNVSATQELTRQLQAQATALAAVRKERDALAKEVAELRTSTSKQEQRLSSIEARFQAITERAGAPGMRQVKLGSE